MITVENFLQGLLTSQNLDPEQDHLLQLHKAEITAFLRAEFGNSPVIKYAGSREKGTMIRDNFDLDIVCYFPSSDIRSLKEIRDDVSSHLSKKYLIEGKASAERIKNLKGVSTPQGYHIDVVPGRFIEGSKDVFIHVAYGEKERMQTNLNTHIDHIANSGCVPVIRLIKIWALRNNVQIKTFILELFVVETLNGSKNKDNLQSSFLNVIEALKNRFGNLQLVDPANTNNVVSRTINSSDRALVTNTANNTFNRIEKSNNVSDWKTIFGEKIENIPASMMSQTMPFTPNRPYSA